MPKYQVKDLKPGLKDVNITLKIDFLGEKKRTDGFDCDTFKVSFCTDETGEIKLLFWNDDAKKAKEKMMIRIKRGYVTEWQGQLQLNANKTAGVEFLKDK
jgi:ssDNA-binding replication factor A large subunit